VWPSRFKTAIKEANPRGGRFSDVEKPDFSGAAEVKKRMFK
jgi:hypothetical protein